MIRKSIKKISTNQCPLEFFHRINVQCSKPHAIELSKLLSLTQSDKLPMCSLDGVVYANIDNRVNIMIRLKNSNGDYFDNFTSSINQVKWKFNDNQMQINGNLSSIEIHNRTCYYQNFATHHVVGESNLEANLANLNGALKMILVDYVSVMPNSVTIFNHPSNIAKLSISHGSGYFFTEVEDKSLVKVELSENSRKILIEPENMGNTQMSVYDYCAFDADHIEIIQINVVGINSVEVTLNDTKVELNRNLLLKVKVTDEYGNFIHKDLFKFVNVKYTLTNANFASVQSAETDLKEQADEFTDVYLFKGIKTGL